MSGVGNLFGLSANANKDERKQAFMRTVQQEQNLENARNLIERVNENCYEKCVPKPGASLSSQESKCLTDCMSKYMAAWNLVSSSLIQRIKTEGPDA